MKKVFAFCGRLFAFIILNAYLLAHNFRMRLLYWQAMFRQDDLISLQEAVMEMLHDSGLEKEFGVKLHTQHKPGYEVGIGRERQADIAWEAPICLTIHVQETPIFGFSLEVSGNILCIKQMQGIAGVKLPNELKNIPMSFVKVTQQFVENHPRFLTLRMTSAKNRFCYYFPYEVTRDQVVGIQQRMQRRYEGTARQAGFRRVNWRYWEWRANNVP